MFKVLINR